MPPASPCKPGSAPLHKYLLSKHYLVKNIVPQHILIIAGTRNAYVTELTELSERGIRDLKNQLVSDDINSLFEIRNGRDRKSKLEAVESQVIEEIEKNNDQTLQQIADMIQEKFGIHVSTMAVSRLLKKRNP